MWDEGDGYRFGNRRLNLPELLWETLTDVFGCPIPYRTLLCTGRG